MFVRNLPVENIKSKAPSCWKADIVIGPTSAMLMLKRDDIKSFLDVAVQAMNIAATGRNVQELRVDRP